MKKGKLLALSVLTFMLVACATGEKMSDVELGMSYKQVKERLGRPDGMKQVDTFTWYKYNHRMVSGWSWDRADYHVIFRGGKVVEYGQGQVRQNNNKTLFLISN